MGKKRVIKETEAEALENANAESEITKKKRGKKVNNIA